MTNPNPHPAPSVAVVVDAAGNKHWGSPYGHVIKDGLADGSLREPGQEKNKPGQEATDAPVPASGSDLDPGNVDNGSGDGQSGGGPDDDGDDSRVAGPETSRSTRRRG